MVIMKFYNNMAEDGFGYRLVMLADSYTHTRLANGTSSICVDDTTYSVGDDCEFSSLLVIHEGKVIDRVVHGYPSNQRINDEESEDE